MRKNKRRLAKIDKDIVKEIDYYKKRCEKLQERIEVLTPMRVKISKKEFRG